METLTVTATNLINALGMLPRNRFFDYPTLATKTKVSISAITVPGGPIRIKRYQPGNTTPETATSSTISHSMLVRVAAAIKEGLPINMDRVLGASYNMRSSLEALLAHTPEFHICYPGRIESSGSDSRIKEGHKHLIWLPNDPHPLGELSIKPVNLTISEIPSAVGIYEAIDIPTTFVAEGLNIDDVRRHIQIQLALVQIGHQLGFRTYIARNDQGVLYQGAPIGSMPSVVQNLGDEQLIRSFAEAAHAGRMIDCVWFKNGRLMPAVMEVEHSTGVTPGLNRMKDFYDRLPQFPTRWTIVAPDSQRADVIEKANRPQFRELNAKYFSYSAVEELYSLCQRRRISGVSEEFLDSFMEPTLLS